MTVSDDRRLRIAWVFNDSLERVLDAATWVETATNLHKLGWDVTLVTMDRPQFAAQHDGFTLHSIVPPNIYALRQVIFHILANLHVARHWFHYDIVLFHHQSVMWLLPVILLARATGRRGPRMVMDTRTVPMSVQSLRDRIRAWIEWPAYRLGRLWASGHTAITYRMAEAVGVAGERLWGVWPSGVNLAHFAGASAARRWPADTEPVRIIYIGTLYPERNLKTMCDAVLAANADGMHFHMTIVGAGPQWDVLSSLAAASEDAIVVLRAVPHSAVSALLTGAHVGVLPFPDDPIFQVSSPIKLFEYMAAGLAIMATRVVCHTDVIGDDNYVFWAETSDLSGMLASLRDIWTARDQLPRLGSRAAAAAPAWSWESAAHKLDVALRRGLAGQTVGSGRPAAPVGQTIDSSVN